MKYVIMNQNTKNYGDDIAGITLIENLLERKDTEKIDLIYKMNGILPIQNAKVEHNQHLKMRNYGKLRLVLYFMFRRFGYKGKKNSELRNTINIIDKCDYLFVSPCGANIGIYKDKKFLLRILIAIREGKTPIFCLNTIGSSGSWIFDKIAKFALKRSKVYVREKKSYEYLKRIGIEAKLGVDTAFGYKNKKRMKQREDVIGFVPTFLNSWHPNFKQLDIEKKIFNDVIPQIINFAQKNEYKIELLPHMNTEEEKNFFEEVRKEFEKRDFKNIVSRKDITDTYKYNEAIASCHMIISMRYHGIVLAAKNGIPFLCLAYENKMLEVCNYTDMQQYCIELYDTETNFNNIENILNEIDKNQTQIKNKLEEKMQRKLIKLSKIPLEEIEGK